MFSSVFPNVLSAIGRTPLVRLQRVAEGVTAQVCVKLEASNPGGSIKDRVALAMIDEAERQGWLKPGGTIVEATAGNTGVGLAMAAAVKGYRSIFVLPDKMSSEKIRLLQAYGAEVVITPTAVAPDSPESYNGVADRLAKEIPGAWRPNQFHNLANPDVHYRTTGPEIWDQTEGRVTVVVAGAGTGGTLSGVGRYLKERNPRVQIVGADPEGSVLSGDSPRPWKVEGIGEDFVPKTLNGQAVDEWIRVGDAESFATARALARREGLLVGGSSGTAVAAALQFARRLSADDVVVVICPDTGRNYLSKMFDDEWLEKNGLAARQSRTETLHEVLDARGLRELIFIGPETTISRAVELAYEHGISQLPVLRDGVAIGSIHEVTLARLLHDRLRSPETPVEQVMARPLPQLDSATQVDEAYRLLMAGNTGVLVTKRDRVVDIVTRIDLVRFWSEQLRVAAVSHRPAA
jgi:cystathionine beta-synthase